MPQDDESGFWDDGRGRSQTGPIPRLSRGPKSATTSTSRQLRSGEATTPHRIQHGATRGTHQEGIAQFDDGSYSRQGWDDGDTNASPRSMWAADERPSPLITIRRDRHEQRPNFVIRRIVALVALGAVAAPIAVLIGGGDKNGQEVAASATPEVPGADPALTAAQTALQITTVAGGVAPILTEAPVTEAPVTVVPATAAAASSVPATTAPLATAPATAQATEVAATETTAAAPTAETAAETTRAEAVAALAVADEAPATAATVAPTVAAKASCSKDYDVVVGDYWILIADKVSVRLADLLNANDAKTGTALYPGRTICLPAGASAPTTVAPTTAAPTTAAPTTTDAPSTTAKATTTTVKATTTTVKATTSTVAPSTTAAAPQNSYTKAQVTQIIRDVWPDELEDEAIRIATRESNLIPTVRNACCFGLFQLYWNVHKSWMASAGITSADQLYDPHVNAYAAYAMYLRAGGWGPWR